MLKPPYLLKSFAILILMGIMYYTGGCEKKYPTSPPAPGKVILNNQSGKNIVVTTYTQRRGSNAETKTLNKLVLNRGLYTFTSIIDSVATTIFSGGDVVTIRYRSSAIDPDNPNNYLFTGSAMAEINGNISLKINSDGRSGQ